MTWLACTLGATIVLLALGVVASRRTPAPWWGPWIGPLLLLVGAETLATVVLTVQRHRAPAVSLAYTSPRTFASVDARLPDTPLDLAPGHALALPRPDDDDAVRILFLGDGFTVGAGVGAEEPFAEVVARTLAAPDGRRVEVADHALLAWGLDDMWLQLLTTELSWTPDVVVWTFVPNDVGEPDASALPYGLDLVTDTTWAAPDTDPLSLMSLPRTWLTRRRMIADAEAFYAAALTPGAPTTARATRRLTEAIQITEATGARFVVATMPLLHRLADAPFAAPLARVRRIAEDAGADTVDLTPALSGRPAEAWWVDPSHHFPDAEAHARLGALLAVHLAAGPLPRARGGACDARAEALTADVPSLAGPSQRVCEAPGDGEAWWALTEAWVDLGARHADDRPLLKRDARLAHVAALAARALGSPEVQARTTATADRLAGLLDTAGMVRR